MIEGCGLLAERCIEITLDVTHGERSEDSHRLKKFAIFETFSSTIAHVFRTGPLLIYVSVAFRNVASKQASKWTPTAIPAAVGGGAIRYCTSIPVRENKTRQLE